MALLPALANYYRLTFHVDGSDGEFDFSVLIAMAAGYVGDGTEFGFGGSTGLAQLTAIANGIASGFEAESAPHWDNITLTSIEAQPTDLVTLT